MIVVLEKTFSKNPRTNLLIWYLYNFHSC